MHHSSGVIDDWTCSISAMHARDLRDAAFHIEIRAITVFRSHNNKSLCIVYKEDVILPQSCTLLDFRMPALFFPLGVAWAICTSHLNGFSASIASPVLLDRREYPTSLVWCLQQSCNSLPPHVGLGLGLVLHPTQIHMYLQDWIRNQTRACYRSLLLHHVNSKWSDQPLNKTWNPKLVSIIWSDLFHTSQHNFKPSNYQIISSLGSRDPRPIFAHAHHWSHAVH